MAKSDPANILEMHGINKAFAGNPVLKNIDFEVKPGEIHALMGENGAGKSTLMKILAGVYTRDTGEIRVDGKPENFSGYDQARQAGVCMIYQELSLLPHFSVAENLFLGKWSRGLPGLIDWRAIRSGAKQALAKVGLENLNVNLLVGGLPMATRQLLEVAKALLYDPKVVVFDEPTTTLTGEETERLFRLMADLKKQGKGIVFISHRLKEVLDHSDRITVLKDGEKVVTGAAGDFDENKLIYHMIGRELTDIYPAKPVLGEAKEIFRFDAGPDARGGRLEFAVREGEVLGVGGLAGQGQIPLLESAFGLGGGSVRVWVQGKEYRIANPREAMAAGIALIPEDRNGQAAFLILNIAENIAAASLGHHSGRGFIQRSREVADVKQISGALKVKMTSLGQELMYLSGGNIQKTVFARWLLAHPRVMVLLSPTSGIDVGTKQQIYFLMRELAQKGVAIVMLTGDMMELIGVCDRVMVMYDGCITGFLQGADLTEENIMKASVAKNPGKEAS